MKIKNIIKFLINNNEFYNKTIKYEYQKILSLIIFLALFLSSITYFLYKDIIISLYTSVSNYVSQLPHEETSIFFKNDKLFLNFKCISNNIITCKNIAIKNNKNTSDNNNIIYTHIFYIKTQTKNYFLFKKNKNIKIAILNKIITKQDLTDINNIDNKVSIVIGQKNIYIKNQKTAYKNILDNHKNIWGSIPINNILTKEFSITNKQINEFLQKYYRYITPINLFILFIIGSFLFIILNLFDLFFLIAMIIISYNKYKKINISQNLLYMIKARLLYLYIFSILFFIYPSITSTVQSIIILIVYLCFYLLHENKKLTIKIK